MAAETLTVFLAAALAWGQAPVAGPLPADASPQRLALLGRQAYDRGEYRQSLDYLMEAVLRDPADHAARRYLEAAARKMKDSRGRALEAARENALDGAGEALETARLKARRWADGMTAGARAQEGGAWLVASDEYLRILEDNPKYEEARRELKAASRALAERLDRGRFADVKERHLTQAFFHLIHSRKTPALAEFKAALGYPEIFSELPEYAIRRQVVSLEPRPASAPALAQAPQPEPQPRARRARPQPAAGQPAVEAGQVLVGRSAQALFKRANSLRQDGKFEEAVRVFAELLSLDSDFPGARQAAFQASQDLNEERRRLKAEAEQHYQKGMANYAAGDLAAARREWESAVTADPAHPYALQALGRVQRDLRNHQEGRP